MVSLPFLCPPAHGQAFRGAVEAGFESFAQIYRLTDDLIIPTPGTDLSLGEYTLRDTTDVFTEFRALVEAGFVQEEGPHRYNVRGRFSAGTNLYRQALRADYSYRPLEAGYRVEMMLDVEGRQFQPSSSFSLSSDYLRGQGRVWLRRNIGGANEVGVKIRAETWDYDQRSDFEYDQQRWSVALTSDVRNSLDFNAHFEAGIGQRSVPDSMAIAYDRQFFRGDVFWNFSMGGVAGLYSAVERRVFRDGTIRSPYWDFIAEPEIGWQFPGHWSVRLRSSNEILMYDNDSTIYYDLWLGRIGVEWAKSFGSLKLGLEPRYTWFVSPYDTEDEFRQPSLMMRADWFGVGRFWFSLTGEVGVRRYEVAPVNAVVIYSDYDFVRTTLLLSYGFTKWLNFDGFVSDEPEFHRRDTDDSRLTLYTLSLRATF